MKTDEPPSGASTTPAPLEQLPRPRRREDERFLRGEGRFIADVADRSVLQACFVRSAVASAVIQGVHSTEAQGADGVVAVLDGQELAQVLDPLPLLQYPDDRFAQAAQVEIIPPVVRCLAADRVRYVGEPVAVVVAQTRQQAEDAAELVSIDYDPRVPVLDTTARSPGIPPLYEHCPDNVGIRLDLRHGAGSPHDGAGDGVVVVEGRYEMGRHGGAPLECRGVVVYPGPDGTLELWTSSQIPHRTREVLCAVTGWTSERVRVRVPDIGGGFGAKATVYGEEVVISYVAHRLGHAVGWVEDRYEHLLAAAQSRDQRHATRLRLDAEGRILSWEVDFDVDLGAYNLIMGGVIPNTATHLLGPYRIPSFRIRGRGVFTNKAPTSQYRGAGRPEACFALERSLDKAAKILALSPLDVRLRNLLSADDLPHAVGIPYRDGVDMVYDGGDYRKVVKRSVEALHRLDADRLRADWEARGQRVGTGRACYIEATGRGPHEQARIALLGDGTFEVATGASSSGQGHETTLAEVAARELGVPAEDVRVVPSDSRRTPFGQGTYASRTAVIAGSAVLLAARALRDQVRSGVAEALGCSEDHVGYGNGAFTRGQTELDWRAVAELFSVGGPLGQRPLPVAARRFEPETVTWTMGVHTAMVAIDPESGQVTVVGYAVMDEGGIRISPLIVEGQVRGGVAQGIGGALSEEFRYDDEGQPTSTTLESYSLPTAGTVPSILYDHETVPSRRNPLGVKGAGESGIIPVYAALAAAVDDALDATDLHVARTPIDAALIRSRIRECSQ